MWFCQPLTDIRLQIERLKNSDSLRYLGISLDRNFSFDLHFDKVVKRLSRHVFAVARIRKNLSRNVLIPYYRSFFKAKFRYGLLIYGCTSSKLRPVCMVQRKLLKLLFFLKQRESVDCLFSESTIQSIYDLYTLELLKFVIKLFNAKLPTRCLNSFYQCDVKQCLSTRSVPSGILEITTE